MSVEPIKPIADPGMEAVYHQEFSVRYDYPVHFTEHLFARGNPVFVQSIVRREPAKRHRIMVFVDANVAASWPTLVHDIAAYAEVYAESLELVGRPEVVAGGEQVKNDPALVTGLQRRLVKHNIDRHAFVVGIGGGAFLDMIGFVASTTHRGIRHIRVPTTVLGQNDSGVGVKNGVNAFGLKNLLGSFAPPFAVLNDTDFLRTLHPRDKIAGIAEADKVSLIRDALFFEWLEKNSDALRDCVPEAMARMIRRCAELHMRQIAHGGDPFEMLEARPLDFGHWSAHKLESMSDYEIRHGEAVAIGVAVDTVYSSLALGFPESDAQRVLQCMSDLGLNLDTPLLHDTDALFDGLEEFRQHLGGRLTLTMLNRVGDPNDVHTVDRELMCAAIGQVAEFAKSSAAFAWTTNSAGE